MAQAFQVPRSASIPLKHSLGGKILAGFLLMAAISLFLAISGIFYTNQAGSKLSELISRDQKVTDYVLNMQLALERQGSSMRRYLLLTKYQEPARSELNAARAIYSQSSANLDNIIVQTGIDRVGFDDVAKLYSDFQAIIDQVLAIDTGDFYTAPISIWEQQGIALKNQLIDTVDGALKNYRAQLTTQISQARSDSNNIAFLSLILVLIGGIGGGLVTLVLTRSITRPLRVLAGVAQSIRGGDLTVHVPEISSRDEVAFLSSAMSSMAQNLRQVMGELEASLDNTERRNRELAAVNQVTSAINQSLDLDKVLQEILQQLMVLAEVEYGSLFLLDERGEYLTLSAQQGQSQEYVQSFGRVAVGSQLTGQVAAQGEVVIVENPAEHPSSEHPVLKSEVFKHFYMGVPLKSKGKVVGVVNLTSATVRMVSKSEVELFNTIGSQIGIAIENARLYHQASALAALEERNRLARDLHDSVTQTIFSITLTAESARAMMIKKPERVPAQLERLQSLSRSALSEMRALIFQLRPAALEEQGLVAALEKHIAAARNKEGIEIDFEVGNNEGRRLSSEHEQALYRIAQESMNNIVKHAQANHVWVKLQIDEQKATLIVQDNGVGFDPSGQAAEKNREQKSLGMTSMRERAELAGGTLEIQSQPNQGSTITATLPLVTAPRPVGLGLGTN